MSRLAALATVAVILALPAVARAEAAVSVTGGALAAAVAPGANNLTGHGIVFEPFKDVLRDGFRVRQDQGGRPPFTSTGGNCFTNPVANDVVCDSNGVRSSATVTGGGGPDVVAALEGPSQGVSLTIGDVTKSIALPSGIGGFGCTPGAAAPEGTVTANLGGGDDFLAVAPQTLCGAGSFPAGTRTWRLDVRGGPGADRIGLGPRNDILRGEAQNDVLSGTAGDDELDGGDGADQLNGGTGVDTVNYQSRTEPLIVNLGAAGADDGSAADGPPGQRDTLTSIERVLGGSGNDNLQGSGAANGLIGADGLDRLDGRGGDDIITGGQGADSMFGGEDNDSINAGDAVADPVINCGPGGRDVALLDLRDTPPPAAAGCETVQQAALDDGPPGLAARQRLRRGRRVPVQVRCPRAARVACRGVLTLREPSSRRVLARGRYRVGLGETEPVVLAVRRRLPGAVAAEMREQGVSQLGPRFSSRRLQVGP